MKARRCEDLNWFWRAQNSDAATRRKKKWWNSRVKEDGVKALLSHSYCKARQSGTRSVNWYPHSIGCLCWQHCRRHLFVGPISEYESRRSRIVNTSCCCSFPYFHPYDPNRILHLQALVFLLSSNLTAGSCMLCWQKCELYVCAVCNTAADFSTNSALEATIVILLPANICAALSLCSLGRRLNLPLDRANVFIRFYELSHSYICSVSQTHPIYQSSTLFY